KPVVSTSKCQPTEEAYVAAPATEPSKSMFEDIQIIDCDAHVTEPPDLWSSRAPAALKSRMPQMRTVDGVTAWYLDDEYWCTTGGNVIEQGPNGSQKVVGSHILQPSERIAESAWQVKPRLDVMDQQGVWAQILYPNAIGFSSNHIVEVEDLELRKAILTT